MKQDFNINLEEVIKTVLPWSMELCRSIDNNIDAPKCKKKVIAIIIDDYYRFDSISTSASEQFLFLSKMGMDVRIICNNLSDIKSNVLIDKNKSNLDNYDLLLYHYYIGDSYLDNVINSNVKKICFYQGITTPPDVYLPYSPESYKICKNGLSNLDKIRNFDLVLSDSISNILQLESVFKNIKYKLLPPILTVNRFKIKEKEKLDINNLNILYVGRVFSSKNLEGVISFCNELYKITNSKIILNIVCSKLEDKYVKYLNSLEKLISVIFHIKKSDSELKDLYNRSNIFTTFSHHEGFCIPLLEAMNSKCLIVTHKLTAIPETLKDSGILVNKYDYKNAAIKVSELMRNIDDWDDIIKNQCLIFEKYYSSENIIKQYANVFEDILDSL